MAIGRWLVWCPTIGDRREEGETYIYRAGDNIQLKAIEIFEGWNLLDGEYEICIEHVRNDLDADEFWIPMQSATFKIVKETTVTIEVRNAA